MSNAKLNIEKKSNNTVIHVIGPIDETFSALKSQIPQDSFIEFNLKQVKSINSTGIREWIGVMNSLKKSALSFSECPKVFIDQANMVNGFLPTGSKVISFYVPYYNEDSDSEKLILYTEGKDFSNKTVNVREEIKDEQGNSFELDVAESKYFKFIKG